MTLQEVLVDRRKMYFAFVHVALIVLGVEVVLLAAQNRELKTGVQFPDRLKPGDTFSFSSLSLIRGDSSGIAQSRESLLYLFSTKCPYCKRNLPSWNKIYDVAKTEDVSVVGVCVDDADSIKPFLASNPTGYPIFAAREGQKFSQMNNVTGVPQTVLRSSAGIVEKIWPAVLSDSVSVEIVRVISSGHNKANS